MSVLAFMNVGAIVAKNEEVGNKVRVSLDLSAPFHRRLTELEYLTHAESKAGVIRQALQIYEYVAKKTLQGHKFMSVDKNGNVENLVFFSPYMPQMNQDKEDQSVMTG
jgi:hypothetical protein